MNESSLEPHGKTMDMIDSDSINKLLNRKDELDDVAPPEDCTDDSFDIIEETPKHWKTDFQRSKFKRSSRGKH